MTYEEENICLQSKDPPPADQRALETCRQESASLLSRAENAERALREYQSIMAKRLRASQRAVEIWQQKTGQYLAYPEHEDLCVWLMQQWDIAAENARKTAQELDVMKKRIAAGEKRVANLMEKLHA